jgi:hypothetical protein
MNWYYCNRLVTNEDSTPQLKNFDLDNFPICKASDTLSHLLNKLVFKILDKKSQGKGTATLEQEIDNLVYKLYELTYDEVKVIDPAFSLSKKEYEAIKLE